MKTVKKKNQTNYHPFQVPHHLYEILERRAREQRLKSGNEISWSGLLRTILEEKLTIKNN